MLTSLFGLVQGLVDFLATGVRELFSILSLTRQLADLVSKFLRMFGF